MNSIHLLFLLQLFCFTEINTSAKPYNGTKIQTKDARTPKGSLSTSMVRYDNDRIKNHSRKPFLFRKQKLPRPSVENSLKRVRKITKLPTATSHCKIFCRSGYHLQILPNGAVKGTVDQDSKYGKFS